MAEPEFEDGLRMGVLPGGFCAIVVGASSQEPGISGLDIAALTGELEFSFRSN